MPNFSHNILLTIGMVCGLLCLIGCGSGRVKPAGFPPLYSCVLTFTQEGKPLAGALLTLYSTDPEFKWSVGGTTDQKGAIVLKTNGFFEGVPLGTYRITLKKIVREGPPLPDITKLPESEDAQRKIYADIARKTKFYSVIDAKFLNEETTTLEYEVKKGKNTQTFDLGPQARDEVAGE